MQVFDNIVELINKNVFAKIQALVSGVEFFALYALLVLCLVAIVTFAIVCIARQFSASKTFLRDLITANKYIEKAGSISDENVDGLTEIISKMPRGVVKGWSSFLEERYIYPSDYITEAESLKSPRFSESKYGLIFFLIVNCVLAVTATIFVALGSINILLNLAIAIGFPVALDVIGALLIISGGKGVSVDLREEFYTFQDNLDSGVALSPVEEEAEISVDQKVKLIEDTINEIVAKKRETKSIVMLLEEEPIEEPKEEIPAVKAEVKSEEKIEEVAASEAPVMNEEQKRSHLEQLLSIVDNATADFKNGGITTKEDLEMIAVMMVEAIQNDYSAPEDIAVLEEGVRKLSDTYFD